MPYKVVNGCRYHYMQWFCDQKSQLDTNNSKVVVMVHGLGTSLGFWCLNYLPAFVDQYNLITYDLKGHGKSEMPKDGYTVVEMAQDLKDLLSYLGVSRAHFISHSFGGRVVLRLAMLAPEYIDTITLLDTHINEIYAQANHKKWLMTDAIKKLLASNKIEIDYRDINYGCRLLTELARLVVEKNKKPQKQQPLANSFSRYISLSSANKWLKLLDTTSAWEQITASDQLNDRTLKKISLPILAIYAEESQAMVTGNELLQIFSKACFIKIKQSGHFFPISKSSEVIQYCTQFWSGNDIWFTNNRFDDRTMTKYFRSNRIYNEYGNWFYRTRETHFGPFTSHQLAEQHLKRYIESIS